MGSLNLCRKGLVDDKSTGYSFSIFLQDDKPINHLVHEFEVTDRDDNDRDDRSYRNGSPFIFEIRSGNSNNAFRITESGELRTAMKFNHKLRNSYRLQVGVYDSGNPPLYSETWLEVKVSCTNFFS